MVDASTISLYSSTQSTSLWNLVGDGQTKCVVIDTPASGGGMPRTVRLPSLEQLNEQTHGDLQRLAEALTKQYPEFEHAVYRSLDLIALNHGGSGIAVELAENSVVGGIIVARSKPASPLQAMEAALRVIIEKGEDHIGEGLHHELAHRSVRAGLLYGYVLRPSPNLSVRH